MRRGRPWMDSETGEWHNLPLCPGCELVLTPDGRDCPDCARARQHTTTSPALRDAWKDPHDA